MINSYDISEMNLGGQITTLPGNKETHDHITISNYSETTRNFYEIGTISCLDTSCCHGFLETNRMSGS